MKRLSWKYIAGLIDGEGCIDFQNQFGSYGSKRYSWLTPRLRITLSEPSKEVLEILHANQGGSLTKSNRSRNNPNWSDALTWQVQGRKSRGLIQQVEKHLILKREQARFVIWWIDTMMGQRIQSKPAMKAIREAAKAELKAMKHDPQRLSERAVKGIYERFGVPYGAEADAIVQAANFNME